MDATGTLNALNIRAGAAEIDVDADARTRLREAALGRFGRQGVNGTTTREIIADAGLRNPSAITYYFGSKGALVEDLVREVNLEESAIIQRQVRLASASAAPTPEQWAAAAVDAASGLLATERGCLLIRVWAELDALEPDAVEVFLAGDHPLARSWRAAVAKTFPAIPAVVAIARNVVVLRTLQWMTVRRARRFLSEARPPWQVDPGTTRPFVLELVLNMLTPASTVTEVPLLEP